MIHEFIEIIQSYKTAKKNGLRSVIATVVDLEGSSYRKPGVRMIIHENGEMTGAVSGGCVENEILKQSYSVFKSGISKIIAYDGRYRIGCEGVLYILIEKFDPESEMLNDFGESLKKRNSIEIRSYFEKNVEGNPSFGSVIHINENQYYPFYKGDNLDIREKSNLNIFSQKLAPLFRLIIIGAEHDAIQLSKQAVYLGWEVIIIAGPSNPKGSESFPEVKNVLYHTANDFDLTLIDKHSAVLLMTHNYARDLQFLIRLKKSSPAYLGLLGATNRRERLLNEFIERNPDVEDSFLDQIYAPTGLHIGAISPQEISLSICAEIVSVIRKKEPKPLKNLTGSIHQTILDGL